MKYKIRLTCYDFGNREPYYDEVDMIFDNKQDAMVTLLQCAIEEADELNNPFIWDGEQDNKRYFRIDLDTDADAVIRCWYNDEDYSPVTIYNIVEVQTTKYMTVVQKGMMIILRNEFEAYSDIEARNIHCENLKVCEQDIDKGWDIAHLVAVDEKGDIVRFVL